MVMTSGARGSSPADLPPGLLAACHAEGFALLAVAPPTVLDEARAAACDASTAGLLDGLGWMTPAWLDRATDPGTFLPGARSVLLLALPYRPGTPPAADANTASRGRIAAYAAGRDYHRVFEKKLRRVARFVRDDLGASARPTVDYGPLLERPLAAAAGLGWLGKSTMLLVPGLGPWVLLGAIATTLDIAPGTPLRKSCGSCSRCISACPTGALAPEGHLLDARLCISYHTIENRGPVPRELRPRFGAWIFGCDDCLSSCPVGAASTEAAPELLPAAPDDAHPELAPLLRLSEEAFVERYRGRAIMRARRDGFLRNVCIAIGNVGVHDDLPALLAALDDAAPIVRGHAAWAIARLLERLPSPALREVARASLAAHAAGELAPFVRDEYTLALESLFG